MVHLVILVSSEATPDSKVDILHSTVTNTATENLIHLRTDPGGSYVTRGLYVKIGRDGQYDNSAAHYDIVGSAGNSGFHAFEVQGDEKLRITKDGKLLIGSDTGSVHGNRLLQVGKTDRSETYVSIVSSTSGESGLLFADTTTNDTGGYRGQIRYHHSDDSMNFRTGAEERLRITSQGNMVWDVIQEILQI